MPVSQGQFTVVQNEIHIKTDRVFDMNEGHDLSQVHLDSDLPSFPPTGSLDATLRNSDQDRDVPPPPTSAPTHPCCSPVRQLVLFTQNTHTPAVLLAHHWSDGNSDTVPFLARARAWRSQATMAKQPLVARQGILAV